MVSAIQLLKTDHTGVRKLLKELEDTTERASKTRAQLLTKIAQELRAHGTIEEEIFYPALRGAAQQEDDTEVLTMVAEAYEEHRAAVQLVLVDLERTDPGSIQFSGRAKVLKELIEHHAREEEKEMFKEASRLLERSELATLGARMEERKAALLAAGPKASGAKRKGTSRSQAAG
jgi:hemerythrin-like domain-containing protein